MTWVTREDHMGLKLKMTRGLEDRHRRTLRRSLGSSPPNGAPLSPGRG
jgi:hypothetical protein